MTRYLPTLTLHSLMTLLIAGALATTAFDFYGKALSPMLGHATLAPVPLANGLIKTLTGAGWRPGANFLHYFAGMVAYPLGWWLIARPLMKTVTPSLHWLVGATAYGVALWVLALYLIAHLLVGNPAFLGFTGITWVALAGHILLALVAAWVIESRHPVTADAGVRAAVSAA